MTEDHDLTLWREVREELRESDPHMHHLLFELGVSSKVVAGMFGFLFEADPNAYIQGDARHYPPAGV